ncbi:MAG: DinB family protein [Vicingaceae bacterium]
MNTDSFPDYFHAYISKIPDGNPIELLQYGIKESLSSLAMVSEEKANQSYEEGKWSIKDIIQHLIDTERIFCYRALAIARGETIKLPGYNHASYAENATANSRSLKELMEELRNLRQSSIDMFRSFTPEMLKKKGNANGLDIKVEQLQYILVGHEIHHLQVIHQKYLK